MRYCEQVATLLLLSLQTLAEESTCTLTVMSSVSIARNSVRRWTVCWCSPVGSFPSTCHSVWRMFKKRFGCPQGSVLYVYVYRSCTYVCPYALWITGPFIYEYMCTPGVYTRASLYIFRYESTYLLSTHLSISVYIYLFVCLSVSLPWLAGWLSLFVFLFLYTYLYIYIFTYSSKLICWTAWWSLCCHPQSSRGTSWQARDDSEPEWAY